MKNNLLINELSKFKIIPVIVVDEMEQGLKLAQTLIEADLPIAEITFRSPNAHIVMKEIKAQFPQLIVGAGTVLNNEQVKNAKDANADFIVSPGFNINTLKACQDALIPIIPGINNPTSIEMALNENIQYLKFFPAEASGGIKMIQALLAPYKDIYLMPTGGINQNNVCDYLKVDRVFCCGLSWMVDHKLIQNNDWDEIKTRIHTLKNSLKETNILLS